MRFLAVIGLILAISSSAFARHPSKADLVRATETCGAALSKKIFSQLTSIIPGCKYRESGGTPKAEIYPIIENEISTERIILKEFIPSAFECCSQCSPPESNSYLLNFDPLKVQIDLGTSALCSNSTRGKNSNTLLVGNGSLPFISYRAGDVTTGFDAFGWPDASQEVVREYSIRLTTLKDGRLLNSDTGKPGKVEISVSEYKECLKNYLADLEKEPESTEAAPISQN